MAPTKVGQITYFCCIPVHENGPKGAGAPAPSPFKENKDSCTYYALVVLNKKGVSLGPTRGKQN